MKSFLKKIIPNILLDYKQKQSYRKDNSRFRGKTTEETFKTIYNENLWGSSESISGQGSILELSKNAIQAINTIIEYYNITSILDLPCGDFNWMQHVNLKNIQYLGGDIVEGLIQNNLKNYQANTIDFQQLNIIEDQLPKANLIVVRDCFVHFSYEAIFKALNNIQDSKSTYLLTTTFTSSKLNYDIVTGDWRPINLTLPPFNFPAPLFIQEESYNPQFKVDNRGKAIALWKISDLNLTK